MQQNKQKKKQACKHANVQTDVPREGFVGGGALLRGFDGQPSGHNAAHIVRECRLLRVVESPFSEETRGKDESQIKSVSIGIFGCSHCFCPQAPAYI